MPEFEASGKLYVISRFMAYTGLVIPAPFERYPLRDKPDYHVLETPSTDFRGSGVDSARVMR
jgi:hypothetical protein